LEKVEVERIVGTEREVMAYVGGKRYRGTITSQYGDEDQFHFRGTEIEKGQETINSRVRAFDLQLPY